MFRLEFHTEAIFQVLKTLWQSAPLWPKVTKHCPGGRGARGGTGAVSTSLASAFKVQGQGIGVKALL